VEGAVGEYMARALVRLGMARWCAGRSSGRATILMYHGVTDCPPDQLDFPRLHLNVDLFRQQMAHLAERYNVMPLRELVGQLLQGDRIGPRTVCLTFDDGYSNVVRCALPILREFRLPATLFVVTGLVRQRNMGWWDQIARVARMLPEPLKVSIAGEHILFGPDTLPQALERLKAVPDAERERALAVILGAVPDLGPPGDSRMATEEELRAWIGDGMSVGSHTVTHPILTRLTPQALGHELADSRSQLEAMTGQPVDLLCYPNGTVGDFDASVVEAARTAGYEAAVTTIGGQVTAESDLMALRRYDGNTSLVRLQARVSGAEPALRRLLGRSD